LLLFANFRFRGWNCKARFSATEILDKSTATQWRHITDELNPADDGSRDVAAAFFVCSVVENQAYGLSNER
jgi:hypothetical protein